MGGRKPPVVESRAPRSVLHAAPTFLLIQGGCDQVGGRGAAGPRLRLLMEIGPVRFPKTAGYRDPISVWTARPQRAALRSRACLHQPAEVPALPAKQHAERELPL